MIIPVSLVGSPGWYYVLGANIMTTQIASSKFESNLSGQVGDSALAVLLSFPGNPAYVMEFVSVCIVYPGIFGMSGMFFRYSSSLCLKVFINKSRSNPIQYWCGKASSFPQLSQLACKYLALQLHQHQLRDYLV